MAGNEVTPLAALGAALDAATVRQHVVASNIANANVPGYTPMSVSFSVHMESSPALGFISGNRAKLEVSASPRLDANGQPMSVRIDDEVAVASQNALHYQALIKGLNRYLGLLGSAISEGKR
jgi:flagellar basal-body rod protein FlgB